MSDNKANFAKIGFFVLTGTALIIAAVIIVGAKIFNKEVVNVETYFTESVTGLDVGSPVKYRGVPVGEVKDIGFVYANYRGKNGERLKGPGAWQIMVVMSLFPDKFTFLRADNTEKIVAALVERGLRTKLSSSGVTGLAYLELDYSGKEHPEGVANVKDLGWIPNNPYIPASSSMMDTLKRAMDDVVMKVGKLDIVSLGDGLLRTLNLLQEKMSSADVKGVSQEATSLLSEVRKTNDDLRRIINSPSVTGISSNIEEMATSFRLTVEDIRREIKPLALSFGGLSGQLSNGVAQAGSAIASNQVLISKTILHLNDTVQALNRAVSSQQSTLQGLLRSSREAAGHLDKAVRDFNENPSVLLFGEPPAPLPENKGK